MNLRTITSLAGLILLAVTSDPRINAQTATPPAAAPIITTSDAGLPVNHVDGGLFYNSLTSPSISGWGAYSHQIASSTYSYSLADITAGTLKPFNPRVTTTSGLAQRMTTFGGWNVFAIGTAGVASSVGATAAAGFAASAGFFLTKPLKNGWTLDIPIRVIAGTGPPQYVFGIGTGWGK